MMRSVRPAVGGEKALEDGRGRGWAARRMYRGFASVCEPEDIAAGEGLRISIPGIRVTCKVVPADAYAAYGWHAVGQHGPALQ